ncbi:putative jacalin-like lectin domain-containing protein [Helianthus annuus]|nr:putative jacalin-like lectin domain-containing protein [Helianthus annuus]KAJ0951244.1 putative jacalin-like lectin domain-containing protein [Helianthus annuus]
MGSTSDFEGLITHGPWGTFFQGEEWAYKPKGSIEKIIVQHGEAVDSITFQSNSSEDESQGRFLVTMFLGLPISIDCSNEYLMSISGTVGRVKAYDVVKSICFKTNLNGYGPYGIDEGTAFSYEVKDEVIVGFHGRAGNYYLIAIGVYVIPKSPASLPTFTYEGKIKNELCSRMSRVVMPRDVGPWGAGGGKAWDDGVFSTIKQVHVHVGELNVIYALQFEYQKRDGKSILSQIHGGTDGLEIKRVNLDKHDEFITGISGFYGPVKGYNGLETIASISFHTNKMIHGPFGEERGAGYVYFCSTPYPGKVVGFHGRNNGFLGAIGVHMEYF